LKGHAVSEETVRRIVTKNKGRKMPREAVEVRMSEMAGYRHSEEAKQRMRAGRRAYHERLKAEGIALTHKPIEKIRAANQARAAVKKAGWPLRQR
jgi:hypothetical protein